MRLRTIVRRARGKAKWTLIRFWKRNADVAFHDRRFAKRALDAVGGRRFDVCLAHDTLTATAGRALARRDGADLIVDVVEIPVVGGRMGAFFRDQRPWVRWYMDATHRRVIRSADHLLTVGPALADWTERRLKPRSSMTVIRNAPRYGPVQRSSAIRADLGLAPGERLVLLLGSTGPGYAVEQVVDATSMLPPQVHVAILGPVVGHADKDRKMPYADFLAERVQAQGVVDRFHMLGLWPGDQLVTYASGADLGLITTSPANPNVEVSLPNRIFSYIRAGLPVVCSNIPDIRALVQEYEIGRVLRRQGADEIARVVSEMLADDGLERMRENTARASRELCWEREAERLLDVFERTTGARDGGRVCFIARKDLTINSRARRIVDTLTSNGYDVTVVGGKVPDVGSPYRVPNVEYIAVGIA